MSDNELETDYEEHINFLRSQHKELHRRIHKLLQRGFIPDEHPTDDDGSLNFENPGTGLHVSIDIVGDLYHSPYRDRNGVTKPADKITNDFRKTDYESARFDEWLQTVPTPTWWQRSRADRRKYLWRPILYFLGLVILIAFLLFVPELESIVD